MPNTAKDMQLVKAWLWSIAVLIALMVLVGGATRLTDSGLSITEWKPLLGAMPPLTETQWLVAFEKYKLIPEYLVQNRGMSLAEFKFIFWWEWAHRFLGRLIGMAFALPLAYFIFTKRLSRELWPRLFLIFVLGGAQGALGWYMVSSGLVGRVDVSQYRLAAHLTLAFAIFAVVVWTALTLASVRRLELLPGTALAIGFICLTLLQVAAGGFVAGLDAGHASDTWPQMNGAWWPEGLNVLVPAWRNGFENALAVQFIHRLLAYVVLASAMFQVWQLRSASALSIAAAVGAQVALGILTVLWHVPLGVALLHQLGALVVLALALWHLSTLTQVPAPDRQ
jgi:heme a synthase